MRQPEYWTVQKLRFVGEQDGPVEQQLKLELVAVLSKCLEAERAYLVRVVYDEEQTTHVALAVCSTSRENDNLKLQLGNCFVCAGFSSDSHLDIIFASNAQEAELSLVCRPFYQSEESAKYVQLAKP